MRRRLRTGGWLATLLVAGAMALTLALGFCLFEADPVGIHHHVMSPDVCAGFLLVSVAVALLGLAEIDRLPVDSRRPVYGVSLLRLDPPPKFAPIS